MYYAQDLRAMESVSKITQESVKNNPKDFWDAEIAQFKVTQNKLVSITGQYTLADTQKKSVGIDRTDDWQNA